MAKSLDYRFKWAAVIYKKLFKDQSAVETM